MTRETPIETLARVVDTLVATRLMTIAQWPRDPHIPPVPVSAGSHSVLLRGKPPRLPMTRLLKEVHDRLRRGGARGGRR